MKKDYQQWLALSAFVLVCFAASVIGAVLTAHSVREWYPSLVKPGWTPPNAAFGPVWTFLYLSMALAAWLVWRARGFKGAAVALGLFALQLVLNVAWSGLFFGMRSPLLGLIDIVLLWAAILATLEAFRRINTFAGLLFVPYLLWVSYAAALNFAIWRLNL